MSDPLVKYGILGTGRIASKMVPYIREAGNSEVCAVAASESGKAAAFAEKFRIAKSYGGYASLLKDPDVDAVYIALPNSLHFEYAKAALEHGKHVLCEKPFVLESGQLAVLEALARRKDLKLMECLWYRFHPLVGLVKSAIKRELGAPLGYYSSLGFANASEKDIRWNPELGGGALYDLTCYQADAVNYLFDLGPDQLNSLEAFSRRRNGVEANVDAEAVFLGEFQVNLSASIDRQLLNRTTIVGTEATLVIPNLLLFPEIKESFFYLLKNGAKRKIEAGVANAYAGMVKDFSAALLTDGPVPVGIEASRKNLAFLEKVKAALGTEMADRTALYPKARNKFRNVLLKVKRKWA